MKFRVLIFYFAYFKMANSQYYSVLASSYPSCYNYYSSSTSYSTPTYAPATPNFQPKSLLPPSPKCSKRNVGSTAKPSVKCSPQTASAYFLTTPLEKVKANVDKEKVKEAKNPTPYSCPLCNNFANVPKSSKIAPPPPIGSKVLPGILEKIANAAIPENKTTKDISSILSPKTSFSDMYDKHKLSKNLTFDQELLEGFLTGLGIAL